MAQLNCPACYQGMWVDQWGNVCDPQQMGSNMSLNVGSGYHPGNPMWMGTWHGAPPGTGVFGYPTGVPMGHVHCSRPPSPTHSVKSKKSHMSSRRSHRKYSRKSEDSEEDDVEDRRSVFSHNERGERKVRSRDTSSMPREVKRRPTLEKIERGSVVRSKKRDSSSEEYDADSEIQDEDIKIPIVKKVEPPPQEIKSPGGNWECEHCTFVNEADTRVCLVCCKTPTNMPIFHKPPKTEPKTESLAPIRGLERSKSSDDYSKDNSETESVLNKMSKLKINDPIKEPTKKRDANVNAVVQSQKGRASRKISFWPGTKFATLHK